MDFQDLKKFRERALAMSKNEFSQIYKKIVPHVDQSYIDQQWIPFSDSPCLYLGWHSYGEDLFNAMFGEINKTTETEEEHY